MSKVVPFSLKDAPSLIEVVFPAQKVSVEAQKERKANLGQTLTGLGSYWKGRKPLILVRACVLASLLPSTGNRARDIEIFEHLIGASEKQIGARIKDVLSIDDILKYGTETQVRNLIEFDDDETPRFRRIPKNLRLEHSVAILERMPYQARIEYLLRPEEVGETVLTEPLMGEINKYLGTDASNLYDFVKQLGIMRFGHTPVIGDTFAGGGSIPFEAARIGCDVYASDLNPIACMLTWGALNVVGGRVSQVTLEEKRNIFSNIDKKIRSLGIESDADGNRAKAFIYCIEFRCPKTGWMVPISPSWIVSKSKRVVAKLCENKKKKIFDIEIISNATNDEMKEAESGTFRAGSVVYEIDGVSYSIPMKTIRGDRRRGDGATENDLRLWRMDDFCPSEDDIFRDRLYCVHWISRETIGQARSETFFKSVTERDRQNESKVEEIVRVNLIRWQKEGILPSMRIEPGEKTDELIRTRGWTYWHHLFSPRHLLINALFREATVRTPDLAILHARCLNVQSKLSRWSPAVGHDLALDVFYNQAFNTLYNYGCRGFLSAFRDLLDDFRTTEVGGTKSEVRSCNAIDAAAMCDTFITDPPYADAVNYHEIAEYFIAWLRGYCPQQFEDWIWDSRRSVAIRGDGDEFRRNMTEAYRNMATHMPDNGLQIVMFTHQSTSVWADMAQIFWGSGLRVMAAWYIATETTSELKKGGYVQGTVILVLRKRLGNESGYKDEIVQEVKSEVAEQIDTMVGLNQTLKGSGRIENLFEDADLQMAGYAAALRVLTRYTKIDGTDMTKEALRPRVRGEKSLVNEIVEYAVQVANEHMVPEGISTRLWEGLSGSERFYLKMVDIESVGLKKLDNYQNFAKAFRVDDFQVLMGKMEANSSHLKSAKDFKKSVFEGSEFATSRLRALLYAIYQTGEDVEGDQVLSELKELIPSYMTSRDDLMEMAAYLSKQWLAVNEGEARSAEIVRGLIKNERFG